MLSLHETYYYYTVCPSEFYQSEELHRQVLGTLARFFLVTRGTGVVAVYHSYGVYAIETNARIDIERLREELYYVFDQMWYGRELDYEEWATSWALRAGETLQVSILLP